MFFNYFLRCASPFFRFKNRKKYRSGLSCSSCAGVIAFIAVVSLYSESSHANCPNVITAVGPQTITANCIVTSTGSVSSATAQDAISGTTGGLQVDIDPGGQISTTGNTSDGIFLANGNNTINSNNGQITTTGNFAAGINGTGNTNAVTLSNGATITTSGNSANVSFNAAGIHFSGLDNTITLNDNSQITTNGIAPGINLGQLNSLGAFSTINLNDTSNITTTGNGAGLTPASHGIASLNNVLINIDQNASITTFGERAAGIFGNGNGTVNGSPTIRVRNSGLIDTRGIQSAGIRTHNNGDIVNQLTGIIQTFGGTPTNAADESHAIEVRDNSTVINHGQIITAGDKASGIRVLGGLNGTTIHNTSTGFISTTGNIQASRPADGILYQGLNANITNDGIIRTTGTSSTAVQIGTNGNATNQHFVLNTGTITTENFDAKGIFSGDFTNATNTGLISVGRTAIGSGSYGIDLGSDSRAENFGDIETFSVQGYGIVVRANSVMHNHANATITTTGISGLGLVAEGTGSTIINDGNIVTSNINSDGIFAFANADITNTGNISATGAGSDGIQIARNSTVLNSGTIDVGATGILASVSTNGNPVGNNTIHNTIGGFIRGADGIFLGDSLGFPSSVRNGGTIFSTQGPNGQAIKFSTGTVTNDDTLTIDINTPALIVGGMDMNNGDDTIILDRSNNDAFGWRWTFDDFDPNATITTGLGGCAAVSGDCVELNLSPTDVYFISPETDFQRTNDPSNEGITILIMETGQIQYVSDVSLDIVTSAHAAIDSRIEQAWKIHLRDERELQEDEIIAFDTPERRADLWFRPWAGMRYRTDRGYLPETMHHWAGFLGGINVSLNDNWHIGALGGLAKSHVLDGSTGATGTLDHKLIGAQAHYDNDNYFIDYSILFGESESDGLAPIKNNLVAGGIEGMSDSPLLRGPFESHSLRVGRRFQLHDDRWDLFLRPSAHAVYVRQTIEDIVYPAVNNTPVTIEEFTTESIQARLEMASELIRTNSHGVFHSDLRMGLAMRGVIDGGGATVNTTTDQVAIGVEKEGDYTYSLYAGLGFAWERSEHWVFNVDGEADYSLDKDFTGRVRGAANFRF